MAIRCCGGGDAADPLLLKGFEDKFSTTIASAFYEQKIKPMVLDPAGLTAQVFEAVIVAERMYADACPTAETSPPPPFGCVLCGQMKRVIPKNGLVSFELSNTHIAKKQSPHALTHGIRFFCCASHACYINTLYDATHFLEHFKSTLETVPKANSLEELVGPVFAKKTLDKWKTTPKTKELPMVVETIYKFRKLFEKMLEIMNPTIPTLEENK